MYVSTAEDAQWNLGPAQVVQELHVRLAYVGSTRTPARQVQINSLPFGATFQAPTRIRPAPPHDARRDGAATDVLRPFLDTATSGVGLQRLRQIPSLQTHQPPVRQRVHVLVLYVWSKALGINNDDFAAVSPNQTDEQIRRLDYSLTNYDRRTTSPQLRLSDAE